MANKVLYLSHTIRDERQVKQEMVDTNKLKAAIVEKGLTQTEVHNRMGLTKRQWQCRMEKKKFDSEDMLKLVNILEITDPMPIFFVQ